MIFPAWCFCRARDVGSLGGRHNELASLRLDVSVDVLLKDAATLSGTRE
ncbi:MAG: hypothetical protein K8U57_03870 [Planctomycetes bacterium]|nr:hypothetical protein [Planctomycetota bacterium]